LDFFKPRGRAAFAALQTRLVERSLEFSGGRIRALPEKASEVGRIIEAQASSDLGNARSAVDQRSLRLEQDALLYELPGSLAGHSLGDLAQAALCDLEARCIFVQLQMPVEVLLDESAELIDERNARIRRPSRSRTGAISIELDQQDLKVSLQSIEAAERAAAILLSQSCDGV